MTKEQHKKIIIESKLIVVMLFCRAILLEKKSDFYKNGITVEFNQDNHSKSCKRVLRGLHYQAKPFGQAKLVRCPKGRIYDVAVDIRPNSPTYGEYVKVELSEDNKYINFIDETTQEILDEVHCATPPICDYHGEKIYQAMAFVPKHQKELLDAVLDECAITSWHESGIDLIPLGGGKSKGIQQFLDANHMKVEETMAFGDGDNDVDMLEFVGIGVAMGNGTKKAKAAADYVTDTVDNNGVEKALRHFGVID